MIASGEDELAGEVDLSRRPCSLVIVSGSRKETMSGSENEYFQKAMYRYYSIMEIQLQKENLI